MFDETLRKFVLVIALFVVFVILGNFFAASHQAATRRAGSMTRRSRRTRRLSRGDGATSTSFPEDLPDEGGEADLADSKEDTANQSIRKRLVPQLVLSGVALAVAGLALYVMWRVADSG